MSLRGDCLSCKKIAFCQETSVDRAIQGHTCVFFEGVEEPVYLARMQMIHQYGEIVSVEVIANRRRNNQPLIAREEEDA